MTPDFISTIMKEAIRLGIPTVVDSKSKDTMTKYKGCTMAVPTKKEVMAFNSVPTDLSSQDLAAYVRNEMDLKALGLKMGAEGIMLALPGQVPEIYPPLADDPEEEVADVTGAGDTVAASSAIGLAMGWDFPYIVRFANVAAGVVVRKKGVATATPKEIQSAATRAGVDLLPNFTGE
jgi:D-beta-D-heptose 7-phosphate kinase/D-beta-D-heptose 1-phosphate adenosyltransferase